MTFNSALKNERIKEFFTAENAEDAEKIEIAGIPVDEKILPS
jgi:hypothetical protein